MGPFSPIRTLAAYALRRVLACRSVVARHDLSVLGELGELVHMFSTMSHVASRAAWRFGVAGGTVAVARCGAFARLSFAGAGLAFLFITTFSKRTIFI